MGELIAELRKLAEWPDDYGPASINDIAERAAAALEAAREDAERYRWLLTKGKLPVRCSAGYYYEDGVTYPTAEAAIDQARGKAGQEVGTKS